MALWAHPLDMQARSHHSESLFTPVKRLRTRGGFGRSGTGCSEHRHLERACERVVLLVGLSEEIAAQELKALVEDLRSPEELLPAEREGLLGWCGNWRDDFNADATACEIPLPVPSRATDVRRRHGALHDALEGAGHLASHDVRRLRRSQCGRVPGHVLRCSEGEGRLELIRQRTSRVRIPEEDLGFPSRAGAFPVHVGRLRQVPSRLGNASRRRGAMITTIAGSACRGDSQPRGGRAPSASRDRRTRKQSAETKQTAQGRRQLFIQIEGQGPFMRQRAITHVTGPAKAGKTTLIEALCERGAEVPGITCWGGLRLWARDVLAAEHADAR